MIQRKVLKQLTERAILGLEPGTKCVDGTVLPGGGRLVVRAKSTAHNGARKEFFFRLYADGAEKSMLIGVHGDGSAGTIALSDARSTAFRHSEQLKAGLDPKTQRQMQIDANRNKKPRAKSAGY